MVPGINCVEPVEVASKKIISPMELIKNAREREQKEINEMNLTESSSLSN